MSINIIIRATDILDILINYKLIKTPNQFLFTSLVNLTIDYKF